MAIILKRGLDIYVSMVTNILFWLFTGTRNEKATGGYVEGTNAFETGRCPNGHLLKLCDK